jgi:hypothetical protein
MPTTPRGGEGARQQPQAAAAPNYKLIDLQSSSKRKFETLSTFGGFTQESIESTISILKNALACGQVFAKIQTLRVGLQFHYTYTNPELPEVHHVLTLQPFSDSKARVKLIERDYFDWLAQQKISFLFATWKTTEDKTIFGEYQLADFCHVIAHVTPECVSSSLWNAVYMEKCLDESMIKKWTDRLYLATTKIGATYCAMCMLYKNADYADSDGLLYDMYTVETPRQFLTMIPMRQKYQLDKKFHILVTWCRQMSRNWTLVVGGDWAYFVVLLDPLGQYY